MQTLKCKITIQNSKIISNNKIKGKYYRIIIYAPRIAHQAKPGQFLSIKVTDSLEPLLRRPFSIHRVRGSNIEILYEVVGKGTEILSQKRPGEFLDIIGPLGNGYQIPDTRYQILVGGGRGVAPLLFLAEKIVTSHKSQVTSKPLVLIGAKTNHQILCEKEFKNLGCEVKISTDDGSKSFKGKVTELLRKILPQATSHKPLAIYACGPEPMLKEISRISKECHIPAEISLEAHMACGIGACLGCAVNTKEGYKRVCKEGPVFNADEIIW